MTRAEQPSRIHSQYARIGVEPGFPYPMPTS